MSKPNPFGTGEFVQFRQVFGLHRFKLYSYLVYGTVKSVWFRQVFGLLRVQFKQVFGLLRVQFRQFHCIILLDLYRILFYSGFSLDRSHCIFYKIYTEFCFVQFRQVSLYILLQTRSRTHKILTLVYNVDSWDIHNLSNWLPSDLNISQDILLCYINWY